jgi:hypothetical protein
VLVAAERDGLQVRDVLELSEIPSIRVLGTLGSKFPLLEERLEIVKQRRLVVAKLGDEVVLRVQEDSSVRLPAVVSASETPGSSKSSARCTNSCTAAVAWTIREVRGAGLTSTSMRR